MGEQNRHSDRFFKAVIAHPFAFLIPLFALLVLASASLAQLRKDTRSDAFLAADNPALVYRDLVRERFGLGDPLIIALVADEPGGIYRPDVLEAVVTLSHQVGLLANVDASRTVSLATESLITGNEFAVEVEPLLDPVPATAAEVRRLRQSIEDFPLFLGSLVGKAGDATVIVAQLRDEQHAEATYGEIQALLGAFALPPGINAHVAGEGAIAGYLGAYIDADAQRLNPLAGVIILLMIIVAFRRLAPALLAVVMIVAAVSVALGTMAALDTPFYVITNALPVILIGIAVADTIHVCSQFFQLQAAHPQRSREQLIVETMRELWVPISVTSITTAAGFLGLYFAAYMPPFRYFGLFAALGVLAAWLYSVAALPALMQLGKLQVHQSFINRQRAGTQDHFSRLMQVLGKFTTERPWLVVLLFVVLAALGAGGASRLTVDADRIRLFSEDEAIAQADRAINTHLNGTNTLDIVIETGEPEGLFDPAVLEKMEALQSYALTLPHVTGVSSIVDYLKQMNRVLNGGAADAYVLPQSREQVAQYFLMYSFSSDPADFEQEVDYEYRTANVRLTLNHGGYRQIRQVVESLQVHLDQAFTGPVHATQSGRVTLNYHWIRNIGESHVRGLVIALLLVWAVASVCFRSPVAGAYALVPVLVTILIVYAFMVWRGMTLGVGTSMFAAVAIGLGVDFAIHTISKLRTLHRGDSSDEERQMYADFFSTTGRALLLNVLAVAAGFGVLLASKVAQLADFGAIVMLSMVVSFLASVTLLPALMLLTRPSFLTSAGTAPASAMARTVLLVCTGLGVAGLSFSQLAGADDSLTANAVVERVNAVPQGEHVTRQLLFRTQDRRGRVRERETISYRRYFGAERRLALFFTAPANIRDTAVLTWDYADPAAEDDQWLYLPALRKVRRIPASDRGDYFLGTDFSFEDMKLDGKLSAPDYSYTLLEPLAPGTYRLAATPRSEVIAKELGYSRTETVVDASNWVVVQVDFWDTRGEPLKTLRVSDVREVDGIWTRHVLVMENHQTGHTTELHFSNVDYRTPVEERIFSQQALKRGV